MKIYSYLGSGKPVVATRLPTHTQVLDDSVASLCEPNAKGLAAGILSLVNDQTFREQLGENGRQLARERYSLDAYRNKLRGFYQRLSV